MSATEPHVPWWKVARRLASEMWLAGFIASAWTVWVWYSAVPAAALTSLIATFFTALFFVAFFTGNVVRVARQTGVQSSFGRLEDRLTALADRLEHSTRSLQNVVTGGDGYASVLFPRINPESREASIMAVQHGDHALFDVTFEVADLTAFDPARPFDDRWLFHYPTLIPGFTSWDPKETIPLRSDPQDFNIFITARNGYWYQRVRFATVNGAWNVAWVFGKRDADGKVVEMSRHCDPEFPEKLKPSM